MVLLDVKLDNFLLFDDFSMHLTYAKKPVSSSIAEEHLVGRPNFRYKKLIVLMGANATGKTALGKVLMGAFNFIAKREYALIAELIEDPQKDASFSLDMAYDDNYLYRVNAVFKGRKKSYSDIRSEDIYVDVKREKILKKQLEKFDGQFDYIFIDCPPQLGILTTNALAAATKVIVPSKAEYLSYRGIRALKGTIRTVQEEFNPDLILEGFVITMFEKVINDQKDMLMQFEKEAPILGIVKKSADAYRSVLDGTPVSMSDRRSDVSCAYVEIAGKL